MAHEPDTALTNAFFHTQMLTIYKENCHALKFLFTTN